MGLFQSLKGKHVSSAAVAEEIRAARDEIRAAEGRLAQLRASAGDQVLELIAGGGDAAKHSRALAQDEAAMRFEVEALRRGESRLLAKLKESVQRETAKDIAEAGKALAALSKERGSALRDLAKIGAKAVSTVAAFEGPANFPAVACRVFSALTGANVAGSFQGFPELKRIAETPGEVFGEAAKVFLASLPKAEAIPDRHGEREAAVKALTAARGGDGVTASNDAEARFKRILGELDHDPAELAAERARQCEQVNRQARLAPFYEVVLNADQALRLARAAGMVAVNREGRPEKDEADRRIAAAEVALAEAQRRLAAAEAGA